MKSILPQISQISYALFNSVFTIKYSVLVFVQWGFSVLYFVLIITLLCYEDT